jgi:hypothetical protein
MKFERENGGVVMVQDSETARFCCACGAELGKCYFDISVGYERVDFSRPMPEVEIEEAAELESFCSVRCLNVSRSSVMEREDVPILPVGIECIEPCARCKGPVLMSAWHKTYIEEEVMEVSEFCAQPLDVYYLAVLCNQCSSYVLHDARELEVSEVTSST